MSEFTTAHITDLQINQAYWLAASGNEQLRQRLIGFSVAEADAAEYPDNPLYAQVAEYMGQALMASEAMQGEHRVRMFGRRLAIATEAEELAPVINIGTRAAAAA